MYNNLGSNRFVRHSTDQQKNRLVKRLTDLGYAVEIKPARCLSHACGTASKRNLWHGLSR